MTKGDVVLKAYKSEKAANEYASKNGGSVEEKYFESNAEDRINAIPAYSQAVFFPRMYWDQDEQRINGYKNWSRYDANDDAGTDIGKDGNRLPTFGENMTYFFRYQVNWMYFRYFMWNFAGRQNDIQGHGDKCVETGFLVSVLLITFVLVIKKRLLHILQVRTHLTIPFSCYH